MQIEAERFDGVVEQAMAVMAHRSRYEAVASATSVPWWWIGCVHQREASGSFRAHLHNGDPLTARTVHVPAGRPVAGSPPFTWETSAADALTMRGINGAAWTVADALAEAERYNGLGYQHRGLRSPYLWGGTILQQPGKYVADGHFDPTAWDNQIGVAALMSVLAGLGVVLTPAGGMPAQSGGD
jgi:lysozyme family protein